tara:strand:- start:615 stop:884 length:270 start_codon:yes stop_codon:yes gene_type:complete
MIQPLNKGSSPIYSDNTFILQSRHVEIHRLEKKIDALIAYCKDLENQNLFLESEQIKLKKERASLIEKNRAAKTKIEQMIEQLKSLGDN